MGGGTGGTQTTSCVAIVFLKGLEVVADVETEVEVLVAGGGGGSLRVCRESLDSNGP